MKFKYVLIPVVLLFLNSCAYQADMELVPPPVQNMPSPPKQSMPGPFNPGKERGVIVLDAGHGGKDIGATSPFKPKKEEKALNLQTTVMVNQLLSQMGYKTAQSRPQDIFISLDQRAVFANDRKAKLFVSIHFNSAPNPKAEGIEVYYFNDKEDKARATQSKKLAQAILDNVIQNTKAKSRGVKHGDLAVIRETNMPAILIECGFITNSAEMDKIRDPQYLKKLATGIAQGVNQYLTASLD